MDLKRYEQRMKEKLHELKTIAEDLEELAENADGYRMQQELYGKAERVYCAMYGISALVHELKGGADDGE